MKLIQLFLLLCLSFEASAFNGQEELTHLRSRLQPLPHSQGFLVKSFSEKTQSYVYDQALAIIAFSKAQDQVSAEKCLLALAHLQNSDGSFYFSYSLDGSSLYPQAGDKRFAGALSWASLSISHYQDAFQSKKFLPMQERLVSYLRSQLAGVKIKNRQAKALRFNPNDLSETAWAENETAALEHNLDFYAALAFYSRLNPENKLVDEVIQIKNFILSLWDSEREHFWSGLNLKEGSINKDEIYLDNQSWSLLALDQLTLKEMKMQSALTLNCEVFFGEHQGILGFKDRGQVRGKSTSHFVWSEGSLGQILAMNRWKEITQQRPSCQGKTSEDILLSLQKMKQRDGGMSYATQTTDPDFTTQSSIAGTVWMYFARAKINPFNPSET